MNARRIAALLLLVALVAVPVSAAERVTDPLELPGDRSASVSVTGTVERVALAAERAPDGRLLGPVRTYLVLAGDAPPILCPDSWVAVERPIDCRTVRPGVRVTATGLLHKDDRGASEILVLDPLILQEATEPTFPQN